MMLTLDTKQDDKYIQKGPALPNSLCNLFVLLSRCSNQLPCKKFNEAGLRLFLCDEKLAGRAIYSRLKYRSIGGSKEEE